MAADRYKVDEKRPATPPETDFGVKFPPASQHRSSFHAIPALDTDGLVLTDDVVSVAKPLTDAMPYTPSTLERYSSFDHQLSQFTTPPPQRKGSRPVVPLSSNVLAVPQFHAVRRNSDSSVVVLPADQISGIATQSNATDIPSSMPSVTGTPAADQQQQQRSAATENEPRHSASKSRRSSTRGRNSQEERWHKSMADFFGGEVPSSYEPARPIADADDADGALKRGSSQDKFVQSFTACFGGEVQDRDFSPTVRMHTTTDNEVPQAPCPKQAPSSTISSSSSKQLPRITTLSQSLSCSSLIRPSRKATAPTQTPPLTQTQIQTQAPMSNTPARPSSQSSPLPLRTRSPSQRSLHQTTPPVESTQHLIPSPNDTTIGSVTSSGSGSLSLPAVRSSLLPSTTSPAQSPPRGDVSPISQHTTLPTLQHTASSSSLHPPSASSFSSLPMASAPPSSSSSSAFSSAPPSLPSSSQSRSSSLPRTPPLIPASVSPSITTTSSLPSPSTPSSPFAMPLPAGMTRKPSQPSQPEIPLAGARGGVCATGDSFTTPALGRSMSAVPEDEYVRAPRRQSSESAVDTRACAPLTAQSQSRPLVDQTLSGSGQGIGGSASSGALTGLGSAHHRDVDLLEKERSQRPSPRLPDAETLRRDSSRRLKSVEQWQGADITSWLTEIGLPQYATSMETNIVCGEMLLRLSNQDLVTLGVTNCFHQRLIMFEIDKLRRVVSPTPVPTVADTRARSCTPVPVSTVSAVTSGSPLRVSAPLPPQLLDGQTPPQSQSARSLTVISRAQLRDFSPMGEGQFGVCYKALWGDQPVVIKVPKRKPGPDEWSELMTYLDLPPHPNVLGLLAVCKDMPSFGERGAQVMSLVTELQLGSLKSLMSQILPDAGPLAPSPLETHYARLLLVIMDMASGVAHLHRHNVIHRDIALRNFLVGQDGHLMVSDFGLCRPVSDSADGSYYMDQQNVLPLRWMAPESLRHYRFTKATDVWMFGVTLWELSTQGQRIPFDEVKDSNDVMFSVVNGERTLHLPQGCPAFLAGLFARCCHPDPAKRPTMQEIVQLVGDEIRLQDGLLKTPCSPILHAAVTSSSPCHAHPSIPPCSLAQPSTLSSSSPLSSMPSMSSSTASSISSVTTSSISASASVSCSSSSSSPSSSHVDSSPPYLPFPV